MMRAAPEMSPTLDDAIRALDGFPGRPADVSLAARFLEQLNDVRDVPAVVLSRAQSEALEGAYLAGFRAADESGHVLVVSLPALLAYLKPAPRPAIWERPALPVLLGCVHAVAAFVALLRDQVDMAGLLLLGAATFLGAAFLRLPPNPCNHNCEQGDKCTCSLQNKRI